MDTNDNDNDNENDAPPEPSPPPLARKLKSARPTAEASSSFVSNNDAPSPSFPSSSATTRSRPTLASVTKGSSGFLSESMSHVKRQARPKPPSSTCVSSPDAASSQRMATRQTNSPVAIVQHSTRPSLLSTFNNDSGLSNSMSRLKGGGGRRERREQGQALDIESASASGSISASNTSLSVDEAAWTRMKQPGAACAMFDCRGQTSMRRTPPHHQHRPGLKRQWFARRSGVEREIDGHVQDAKEQERQEEENNRESSTPKPGAYRIQGPGPELPNAEVEEWVEPEESTFRSPPVIQEAEVCFVKEESTQHCSNRVILLAAMVACFFVVISAVTVAVLVAGKNKDGKNDTSASITLGPTNAPQGSVPWLDCFDTTQTGFLAMNSRLKERQSFNEFVDISLCPGSVFEVAAPHSATQPFIHALPAINLQSNIRIRCGARGALTDECVVSGRTNSPDYLVVNTRETSGEDAAKNVTIEGITFEDAPDHLLKLSNGGVITFRNCVFRSRRSRVPVLVDFAGSRANPQTQQYITFEGCIFEDLIYGYDGPNSEIATLVKVNNPANRITFRECIFRNIQALQKPAFLITSLGAQVRVERSCFYDMGLQRISPVLLEGESGVQSLIDRNDNFLAGVFPCFSKAESLGETKTCQEFFSGSPVCLAPNANLAITW